MLSENIYRGQRQATRYILEVVAIENTCFSGQLRR